ncbi:helix-turn-helix transcriptional regulator [Bacillus cytotoxicus]|uniref:Transcriptional regulator, XRE family n=2 Tax=Bacillus cytotoxicus TaxID=580165 RepID=A0AAX2CJD4_9BACI|nr:MULTISPECIES: helix-turn-helix transcriptional regulator [Bacillus cereus group]ABS22858.1 transcriptional regulator, XRE family [Bacillus cytotoxicus NVH 391-98]AWC29512.1 XRE family transcriptional regulator [Bacillus cytotoxicus]AWC33525.1 XRE family transcriptional regulator [Bacillus cytotoxicus]AWC37502.1 XRE family transcriptional regulator [Bacillus cytotoxicus]AWC41643.1 XRE family transcriptional regulator [Bacillus cytotoxicus]
MSDNIIGIRIKEIRVELLKMSQREFAEALNAKKTMISLYENGKRNPSRETVEKMSRLSGVSADYIMGLSEHKSLNSKDSRALKDDLKELMQQIDELNPRKREEIINMIKNEL